MAPHDTAGGPLAGERLDRLCCGYVPWHQAVALTGLRGEARRCEQMADRARPGRDTASWAASRSTGPAVWETPA
jgi:hypothetical protein